MDPGYWTMALSTSI